MSYRSRRSPLNMPKCRPSPHYLAKLLLAVLFAVLIGFALVACLPGCSPWEAKPVWWEGDPARQRAVYTNQWHEGRFYVTDTDGEVKEGHVLWIPWDCELAAEQTGVFAQDGSK